MKCCKQTDIKVRLENRIISNFYTWRKSKTKRDQVIKTGKTFQYIWKRVGLNGGYVCTEEDGTFTRSEEATEFGWRLSTREILTRKNVLEYQKFCLSFSGIRRIDQNAMRSLWLDSKRLCLKL
jgi:hypothetical protein